MIDHLPPGYLWATLAACGLLFAMLPDAHGLDNDEAYRLREAIASFAHEPDVYEVQDRVLSHRDFDDERPDRWTRRARLSHLLPRVQGQTNWLDQRDRQDQFRENIDADEVGAYGPDNAQHLWRDNLRFRSIYSLRLDFDLSQIVYSSDEMAIQREIRNRWSMRDDLVDQVTELYFARRRLQLHARLFPHEDPQARLDRHLKLQALTARIDALTGGWFRHQLQEDSR